MINEEHSLPHAHVISYNGSGDEYANAIYSHPTQAAIDYVAIANQIMRGDAVIQAERALNSLLEKGGMWCGNNKMTLLLTRCGGGCKSAIWN